MRAWNPSAVTYVKKHVYRKVRERLGVVDATVELWMRRSAAMKARGSSETDIEMLQVSM